MLSSYVFVLSLVLLATGISGSKLLFSEATERPAPSDEPLLPKLNCEIQGLKAYCCGSLDIKNTGINLKPCVVIQVVGGKLAASLNINDKQLISHDIVDVGKACAVLPPPLPPVLTCLQVYYVQGSLQDRTVSACVLVSFQGILSLDAGCFKFDGSLSHNYDQKPDSKDIFVVDFDQGRPNVHVQVPTISGFLPSLG